MNLTRKLGVAIGAVLIAGGLLTGAAFAAGGGKGAERLDQAVKEGKLTEGQAQVIKQIQALRESYRQKFEAERQGILDQAVKDGKITQDQAAKLKQPHMGRHGKWQFKKLSQAELKAKLDEAVKSGRITQDQANKILERHAQHTNMQ